MGSRWQLVPLRLVLVQASGADVKVMALLELLLWEPWGIESLVPAH
jgi:hypothetical protein